MRARWAVVLAMLVPAASTLAQTGTRRPNESRPAIPDFRPPSIARGQILPPVDIETADGWSAAASGVSFQVNGYRFAGNAAISDKELRAIARPFSGRRITLAEIEALRDLLTLAYIERGFVTSGVLLPEQNVTDGVIAFRVVESALAELEVSTDGRFRERYLKNRIARTLGERTANISEIETALQLLLEDERIESVSAELVPDGGPGEARLEASIRERRAWFANVGVANDLAPAIGGASARIAAGHRNLLGIGDRARAGIAYGEGFREVELGYSLPVNASQTELHVSFLRNESDVVTEGLKSLAIEGRSRNVGVGLTHPVVRGLTHRFDASFRLDVRESESGLLGRGFSFTPGPDEGLARVTVARVGQQWTFRSVDAVAAVSSTLSVGLDALDATRDGNAPDGRFVTWLGQSQWVRRLTPFDSSLLVRGDIQLASTALLPLEQFSLGGVYGVRGYRRNAVVRDNGAIVSAEWRVPVWKGGAEHAVTLFPLVDLGHGWNSAGHPGTSETLASMGLGAGFRWGSFVDAELVYARRLRDVPSFGDTTLQDDGLHLAITLGWAR